MFVACSTLCFARHSLENALKLIAELEFTKFEAAISSFGRTCLVGGSPGWNVSETGESSVRRPEERSARTATSSWVSFGFLKIAGCQPLGTMAL